MVEFFWQDPTLFGCSKFSLFEVFLKQTTHYFEKGVVSRENTEFDEFGELSQTILAFSGAEIDMIDDSKTCFVEGEVQEPNEIERRMMMKYRMILV